MALYTLTSEDEFKKLNRLPRPEQTQLYNAIGRTGGADNSGENFFTKRAKSLENAFGTTGAALYESGGNLLGAALAGLTGGDYTSARSQVQNAKSDNLHNKHQQSLDDIIKEAGFNNQNEYYDAKDATEREVFSKYGFDPDEYWNKRSIWTPDGTHDEEVKALDAERQNIINNMSQEDADRIRSFDAIQDRLKGQSASNVAERKKFNDEYEDYVKNNYASQKINQDRGKFAGSAINTLSTMTDVLLPTAGVALNSVQGAAEGLADELEQNGFENFDAGRAAQNAAIGATTGAVVGGLNKGISNTLAKNSGNLFKGGNFATRALNDLGSKTAAGRVGSTLATGAARGAVSGAVGGATGAGLSAAMNNQDIIGSAIEGAKQGFGQGAMTGGIMAGANMALNKTPGVGTAMQKINQASEDWKNGGDTFGERWESARAEDTWGNRFLNNRVDDINAVKQGFQNVGEGVKTVVMDKADNLRSKYINSGAINRLASGIETGKDGTIKFARMNQSMLDDINNVRDAEGKTPITTRQTKAVINSINNHLAKHKNDFGSYEEVARAAFDVLTGDDSFAAPTNKNTNSLVLNNGENFAKSVALDDDAGIRSISPRSQNWAQKRALDRETLLNGSLEGGNSPSSQQVEPESGLPFSRSQTTSSIVPQNARNVNEMPEDIQNMRINTETPETEVYRALTGETESPIEKAQTTTNAQDNDIMRTSKAYEARQRANQALLDQYDVVDAPVARSIDQLGTVEKFAKMGFTKPAEVERIARKITGSQGEVSKLTRKMLASAKPVDTMNGVTDGQTFDDFVNDQIKLVGLSESEAKALKSQIDGLLGSLSTRREGTLTGLDDPNDVFDVIQKLEKRAANYRGKSGENYVRTNPERGDRAEVLDSIATLLTDRMFEGADPSTVVNTKTISELKSWDPNNKQWSEWVDNNFANITSGRELRSFQKPAVDLIKMVEAGRRNYNTFSGSISRAVRRLGTGNPLVLAANAAEIAADTPFGKQARYKYYAQKADKLGSTAQTDARAEAPTSPSTQAEGTTQPVTPSEPVVRTTERVVTPTTTETPTNQMSPTASVAPSENPTPTSITPTIQAVSPEVPTPSSVTPANTNVYNPATQVYNAIGRTEGAINAEQARAADYLANAAQEAEIVPNTGATNATYSPTSAGTTSVYDTVYGTQNANTPTFSSLEEEQKVYFFPPTGDQWTDMLSRAMRRAKDAEDYGAMDQLYEMYQNALTKNSKSTEKDYSNPINWSASDRKELLQAQNGLSQIDSLENSYINAVGEGGGNGIQGTLRGMATNVFGGNLDPSASNYVKQANSLGAGIIKNLINLGSTEYDAERYIDYLPKLTDTKEQAAQKLQVLRNAYENVIANLQSVYNA